MKYIRLILAAIIAALLWACTTTSEVDWSTASRELHLVSLDANNLGDALMEEYPELASRAHQLAGLLEEASVAAGGTDASEWWEILDEAIEFLEDLELDLPTWAKVTLVGIKSAINRIEVYVPKEDRDAVPEEEAPEALKAA